MIHKRSYIFSEVLSFASFAVLREDTVFCFYHNSFQTKGLKWEFLYNYINRRKVPLKKAGLLRRPCYIAPDPTQSGITGDSIL